MFLIYLQRRQLSPEGGGGAGLSLAELEEDQEKNPPKETNEDDPTEDPPVIPEDETEDEKTERLEKEAQEKQDKEDAEQAEKDRKALEGDPKPVDPKKPADKKPEDETKSEDDEETTFWDDVDKLRGGDPIEVDYGDTDPLSPEGALIRENAVADAAIAGFENFIETTYPEAYAFLDHVMSGGKKEDFFKVAETLVTLPTEAELENDVEIQKQLVIRNMTAKGNSQKVIDATIKSLLADDILEEESKVALKDEQKREADSIDKVRKDAAAATEIRTKAITQMSGYINEVVATGEIGGLIIPEKDRKPFADALKQSIRLDNGKWVAVTELAEDNVQQYFKEKFFSFKKGDLKELVAKQARTENTKRLVKTLATDPKKPKGSSTSGEITTTLGEIE